MAPRIVGGIGWIALLIACGPVTTQDDVTGSSDGSSSSSTAAISDSGTGPTPTSSDSSSESSVASGSSESGESPDDGCPAGNDGLDDRGTFLGIEKTWWNGDGAFTVVEASCVGTSLELCEDCFDAPTWLLLLQCTKLDAPEEGGEIQLWSSLAEAEPMLDQIVAGQEVTLRFAGAGGPWGGVPSFTIRDEEEALLLLGVTDYTAEPGSALADVGMRGWIEPFVGLEVHDAGCAWRIPEGQSAEHRRPLAVDLATDDGVVQIFDRDQTVVVVDGVSYDVVVDSAAALDYPTCGGDCPTSEVSLTIVRG